MVRGRWAILSFNVFLLLVLLAPTGLTAPSGGRPLALTAAASIDGQPRFTVRGTVRAAEDGRPMKRVKVVALGTPIHPVFTNDAGRYALTLPVGSYTLRAAGGGCTEVGLADVTVKDHDATRNFRLFRKLDDFGHGCRPIAFKWVNAKFNTGLFGDEFSGRLRVPFAFRFYGKTYRRVFISDNGYLNFLAADLFNPFPAAIPSKSLPNGAIYALWQDLRVGRGGRIDYQTVGKSPNRAFVIEYSKVHPSSAKNPVSFEIKLWQNGMIDILYGSNHANPGDGRNALVGIENGHGTDALQFSFFERLLGGKEAYRFQRVSTGRVHGVVRDANDGEPIRAATIIARPGRRTAETNTKGAYSLRLRPGSYTLSVSSHRYRTATRRIRIAVGGSRTANFKLKASVAGASPSEVKASVELGDTAQATVTISNTGTSTLRWTAKEQEQDQGLGQAKRPPVISGVVRKPVWAPAKIPRSLPRAALGHPFEPGSLSTIIEDPEGDAEGPVDVTTVRAGPDGGDAARLAIDFTSGTPMDRAVGWVFFDTDQDPSTGIPPDELFGKPTQDIGVDYFADLFGIHDPDPVIYIVRTTNFDVVAAVPVTIEGQSLMFDIPLQAIGGDDGFIDTAMVVGNFDQPTDWAPDVGHGTIEPFTDVPWLRESPDAGEVPAGETRDIVLSLGTPDLAAGEYQALLVLLTNAPKQTMLTIGVSLTVAPAPSP
jgi:carboxypeptidase family protein